jgi:predicted MPP superfamily phosphohydrolase
VGEGSWAVEQFEQDFVTTSMLNEIATVVQEDDPLDMILVTGDLAKRGKHEEYQVVEVFCQRLLETSNVPPNRLYLVPGNHDVDRDEVPEHHIKWWYNFENQRDVADVLSSGESFPILMRKFSAFNDFANRIAARHLYDERCYYSVESPSLTKNDNTFCVNIVGLNSALFAGYDGDDEEKLALGLPQVDGAIRQLDQNALLTIVLFHHPTECFHSSDKVCLNQLVNNVDLILTGHLHEPANAFIRNAAGQAVIIGAGASFEKRESENSFNLVEIDLETGRGVVQFYKYLPYHNRWVQNRDANPNHEEGAFVFEIEKVKQAPLSKPPEFAGVIYEAKEEKRPGFGIEIDLLEAVYAVLFNKGYPLHYKEIARLAVAQHLVHSDIPDLPKKIYRRVMQEIKSKQTPRFHKVDPGVFGISPRTMSISLRLTGEPREFYYRFPNREERYIPLGAILVVPSDWIALVASYNDDLASFGPGEHCLDNTNLMLSEPPDRLLDEHRCSFRAHIHFIRTGVFQFLWGTPSAVPMPDPDWQTVLIRGRGYAYLQIVDWKIFVGAIKTMATEHVSRTLMTILPRAFAQLVCERYKSTEDLPSLHQGADRLRELATDEAARLGIQVKDVAIEAVVYEPYARLLEAKQATSED